MGLRTIDLFAGIGGIRLGFEASGCETVFTSEWDSDAQHLYAAYFGDKPYGDINTIDPEEIPTHDLLLAGFPCQPFSIMGKGEGFTDTRGTLFFRIEEILRVKRPSAVFLENVKQLQSHDQGRTLKTILASLNRLGYFTHTAVLNALDFGLPQKRERTFIVGFQENLAFSFPNFAGIIKRLSDILEDESRIDPRLFASETIVNKRLARLKSEPCFPSVWHENKAGNISALPYSCALRAQASYNYLLVNGRRRLSSRELLRLQGFPEDFPVSDSYSAMRKVTGNSVAVPVIEAIAKEMVFAMNEKRLLAEVKQMQMFL